MTLSSALSSALSGLAASTRSADVVSGNLANALNEGFAPRELSLSSARDGRGVRIDAVIRKVDTGLLAERRIADSARAGSEVEAEFAQALERMIGTPDTPGSLGSRLADFEAALVTATARPEDANRLQAVLEGAQALVATLNQAAAGVALLREQADQRIAQTVTSLETGLQDVVTLNTRITTALTRGSDATALQDKRQSVIDELSRIVPLREIPRDNGAIALVTTSGALLLDGRAVALSFSPTPIIEPEMSVENGQLSNLRIDGVEIPAAIDRGPLKGGQLGALFELRDRLSVDAATRLDAVARDIVDRFQKDGLDTSLLPGAAGLFTDLDARFLPENELGLAARLSVNTLVDPAQGGGVFRLRDGLGAQDPGPPGHGALLAAFSQALNDGTDLASSAFGGGTRDAAGHVAALVSQVTSARVTSEDRLSFAAGQASEFRAQELSMGVDSDAELQRLLLVEQAFGANARVIQTIDDMLDTLLRI